MSRPVQGSGFPAGRSIRRLEVGEELSAWRFNQLVDAINALVRGGQLDYRRVERDRMRRNPYPAKITGAAASGSVKKWKYAHEEVGIAADGTVTTLENGRSGTTASAYAINLVELYNVADGTGTQGNSVNGAGADYPDSFNLQPVGGAAAVAVVVMMYELPCGADGIPVYASTYENADDGTC